MENVVDERKMDVRMEILEDAKDEEQRMDDLIRKFWLTWDDMARHKFVMYLLELKAELERFKEEEDEKLCKIHG